MLSILLLRLSVQQSGCCKDMRQPEKSSFRQKGSRELSFLGTCLSQPSVYNNKNRHLFQQCADCTLFFVFCHAVWCFYFRRASGSDTIRVPVFPRIPSYAFSSEVINACLPLPDLANVTAASTLGSIEPFANSPSAIYCSASASVRLSSHR